MKTINIIITGGKQQFGAWSEELPGIYGAGDTVEETKKSIEKALILFKEENEHVDNLLKKEYKLNYMFDISGFLKYYSKFISFAGMKEITGINQKQLWNYAYGYRNPSKSTAEKIMKRINDFNKDISQVKIHF